MKKGKTIQNYANSSRALEELFNNQRSYNEKTGIGYKEEEAGTSTTKYNEPMRSDMHVDFTAKIRKNNLGRQFLDKNFHPGTNIFFMAIVIHVENLVIKL